MIYNPDPDRWIEEAHLAGTPPPSTPKVELFHSSTGGALRVSLGPLSLEAHLDPFTPIRKQKQKLLLELEDISQKEQS